MSDYQEPSRVSSTLRWNEALLPQTVTTSELDALIASTLRKNWLKTARIIGDVVQAFRK